MKATRTLWAAVALGAAVLAAGLVLAVNISCTPVEQRPPAAWSFDDVRSHLERQGLPLEARPWGPASDQWSDVLAQVYLVRPGVEALDGPGVVLVTRANTAEDAAKLARLRGRSGASWGPFVFEVEYSDEGLELLEQVKQRLP
jgi:hypothetical protein